MAPFGTKTPDFAPVYIEPVRFLHKNMEITERFRKIFRRSAPALITAGDGTVLREAEAVKVDSTDMAMTIAAVYRCVNLLSDSVATLPLFYE